MIKHLLYNDRSLSETLIENHDSEASLLSVVIPAYNEEFRLRKTLELLEPVAQGCIMEVIVVCDGCTDRTREVALEWTDRLHMQVIAYEQNRGKGYAVRQGVLAASGDIIAFMDADGSTPPSELVRLMKPLIRKEADIVIGSRKMDGARIQRQPLGRHVFGKVFSILPRLLLSLPYQDTQCGFKLFRRNCARGLFSESRRDGFEFDLDILYRAEKNRMTILEVGIQWADQVGSKVMPIRDGLKMMVAMLQIRMQSSIHYLPPNVMARSYIQE